jgi:ABC-type branched-subunit amino acid transport system substrate-binding protein
LPQIPEVSDDPVVEAEYRAARSAFDAGKLDDAKTALEGFAAAHSDDPLAGPATLLLARIALAQGKPQAARELIAGLLPRGDATAQRALLYDAVALHALGQSAAAFQALLPLTGRLTDPAEADLLVEHLVGAAQDMGEPQKALVPLSQLLGYSPDEEQTVKLSERVKSCLQSVTSAKKLAPVLDELGNRSPILSEVTERFARLAIDEGAPDDARKALEKAMAAGTGPRPDIAQLLDELGSRMAVDMGTIGCILPMSGRSKLVGEQALRGVMLGADRVLLDKDGSRLAVILRDDTGDPAKAKAAVRNLVEQENVAAIIGPLDAAAATAAAEEAERLGVPLLTLSSRENRAPTTTVLRPFTSHRAEVRALLSRALLASARRVVLLVPDSDYGKLVANLSLEESKGLGLADPPIVYYPKDATSFAAEAKKAARLAPQSVLLADAAGKVALLAPALAAAGLWAAADPTSAPKGSLPVQLLVTSPGWSADLPRRAGRYLQGALFADYYESWFSPATQSFSALYADEYAAAPSFIAALGHDAALLVGAALQAAPKSRSAVRDWLVSKAVREATRLPLATSFGGFDKETGEPRAVPVLLRLEGSGVVVAP